MVWLTWRQHRVQLLIALALLVLVAVPLLIFGFAMHDEFQSSGAAGCVRDPQSGPGCAAIVDSFVSRHSEWGNRLLWSAFLPAVAGVFVGAPLLAREFESGTWKFAFTQTVTRTRWV